MAEYLGDCSYTSNFYKNICMNDDGKKSCPYIDNLFFPF